MQQVQIVFKMSHRLIIFLEMCFYVLVSLKAHLKKCFSELVFISVFWSYCQLFHWNICCNLAESKSLWLSRINYVRPACSLIHSSHRGNSVQTQQIRLRIYCIYKPVQHHRLNTENNGVMTTAWKHTNILLQTKQKYILLDNKLRFFLHFQL